ncbi:MAG: hypothetical protein J6K55_10790 [Clostridia bacterium]|nr:hypothetical protein [Clostridia bacterium]
MKAKHGALWIALILAAVVTLLFVILPASANLTIAYIFCLIGIALMESSFLLATAKNIPASYALIMQTGRFLPWSLIVSVAVLVLERLGVYMLPAIWHIVAQVILLAISAIQIVKVVAGGAYINEVAANVENKTSSWRELVNQANMLAARQTDADAKQAVKKVADALRYADPMSTKDSMQIEGKITWLLTELQSASFDEYKTHCAELLLLIQERNDIVRASK